MIKAQSLEQVVFDAAAASMPPGRMRRVDIEPYINSVDQEGLRITVVLDDKDSSSVGGDIALDVLLAISDRLTEAGETRTPTVYFATENELEHRGDPDT